MKAVSKITFVLTLCIFAAFVSGCGSSGENPDSGSVKVKTLDPPTNVTGSTGETGTTGPTSVEDPTGETGASGPTVKVETPVETPSTKQPKKKTTKRPDYKIVTVPEDKTDRPSSKPKKKTNKPYVKPNYNKIADEAVRSAYEALQRQRQADAYDRFPTGQLAVRTIHRFAPKIDNVRLNKSELCKKTTLKNYNTLYIMGDTDRTKVHIAWRTPENVMFELFGDGYAAAPTRC